MSTIEEYGIPFLIGGILFAGTKFAAIKYTSHHMTQKYAALVGSLPLGLLSTLFVIEANKTDAYIRNYTVQTLVTVLAGLTYLIGSHTYYNWSKQNKNRDITVERVRIAYALSIIIWIILSVLKLKLLKI